MKSGNMPFLLFYLQGIGKFLTQNKYMLDKFSPIKINILLSFLKLPVIGISSFDNDLETMVAIALVSI